jgi:hypothetical protein
LEILPSGTGRTLGAGKAPWACVDELGVGETDATDEGVVAVVVDMDEITGVVWLLVVETFRVLRATVSGSGGSNPALSWM